MKRYWYRYTYETSGGYVGTGMCSIKGEAYITKSSMQRLSKIIERDNPVTGVVVTNVHRIG